MLCYAMLCLLSPQQTQVKLRYIAVQIKDGDAKGGNNKAAARAQ